MKLIIAIISNDDSYDVLSELTKAGFDATKLSTTGGFLSAGNVTLLIGVEDSRVDDVMEILRENCSRRTQLMSAAPPTMRRASSPCPFRWRSAERPCSL